MKTKLNDRILFLFTINYPFGDTPENVFINNEIEYLKKIFNKIYIIPKYSSEKNNLKLKNSFTVDLSYNQYIHEKHPIKYIKNIFLVLLMPSFFQETLKNLTKVDSIKRIYKSFFFLLEAIRTKKWMEIQHTQTILEFGQIICYTFWTENRTLGLGLFANRHKNVIVISRAHGIDLYEERKNGYIPLRFVTIKYLHHLILISSAGYDYILAKYPAFKEKYHIFKLGMQDQYSMAKHSTDNALRIISCARMEKVKRIDLLLRSLIRLADQNPELLIEWNHFGSGSEFENIQRIIRRLPSSNLKINLRGNINNDELLEYYKNNLIDIFINTSDSEGLPVSIIEAQNFGIPVIAPALGGIPEIVNGNNGYLLSSQPNEIEIAETINLFLVEIDKIEKKKNEARKNFLINFNAEINYNEFVKFLNIILFNEKSN